MGYDPNEPRDELGRWTDSINNMNIHPDAKKKMLEKIQSDAANEKTTLAFAPFREQNVSSMSQDLDIRNSPEYKLYLENANKLADELGIKINSSMETWGGYVDSETGRPVTEVSNMINVEGDPEKIELMAAVLGKSAPEMQDAVLVSHYTPAGEGVEHTISTGSKENGLKALNYLKSNGIQYFSMDKNNGDIIILDMDRGNTDNIFKFAKDLKSNNLLTNFKYSYVESKFIQQGDYGEIIKRSGGKARTENGFDADAFIKEARGKFDKIKESKR